MAPAVSLRGRELPTSIRGFVRNGYIGSFRLLWRFSIFLLLTFALELPVPVVSQSNNACLPGPVMQPAPGTSTAGIGWTNAHDRLVQEVQQSDRAQGWDLVFYGDSITENWSGYSTGRLWTPTTGIPDVFNRYFGSQYRAGILGIAGDQAYNLLWRMENGEMPARAPRVVVLLIGTNDLMSAWCNDNSTDGSAVVAEPNNLYLRVLDILNLIHTQWPEARVVLMGLLPRGASYADNVEAFRWPNQYTEPMQRVNTLYQYLASNDYRLTYVDCGTDFRTSPLNRDIQGDGTHPNARGMALIGQCLQPVVQRLMALPQNAAPLRTQAAGDAGAGAGAGGETFQFPNPFQGNPFGLPDLRTLPDRWAALRRGVY